jgi:hypothetical protein
LRLHFSSYPLVRTLAVSGLLTSAFLCHTNAQQAPQKPAVKSEAKDATPSEPQNPAQFELLETKYRFEINGDSRKEVHARVHINSELGVRQFARLNFDYNRSFQSVEIPLVRITHPSGGTADILPSAITDNPNPAVVNAPAYQDVRVKSVRILGLAPGDNLDYRVITTTTHHPLAPDFWLDHSFDRTGVVTQEIFELDLPAELFEVQPPPASADVPTDPRDLTPPVLVPFQEPRQPSGRISISSQTPESSKTHVAENGPVRLLYRWEFSPARLMKTEAASQSKEHSPDVVVTTTEWYRLARRLNYTLFPYGRGHSGKDVATHWPEILLRTGSRKNDLPTLYEFVSTKIATIDLPLGSTGFRTRLPEDIFNSGYATAEDKAVLFVSLLDLLPPCDYVLSSATEVTSQELPRPSLFNHVLIAAKGVERTWYLDPSLEVAPFGMIPADLRAKTALLLNHPGIGSSSSEDLPLWRKIPTDLPFSAVQKVNVEATLTNEGKLSAKVHYALRGDNELLLRVGFHQTPKDKWKELAQLLSLSDGFRGQVTSVTASDPYATHEPFTVDYEISQPKFVDWSKKPVRISALLPQLGLPDPPAKPAPGAATAPIELGTPLEVETKMTLRLPPGTDIAAPTGTSVQRDYATFASQYSIQGLTITASRHINFLLRQVPAERAADYNAFLRAVLGDQAQDFTLDRESPAPAAKP